jgi:hypothetical protein
MATADQHHHHHHDHHHGDSPDGTQAQATVHQKLRVLLPHWVEHNAEHAADFEDWAERARGAGLEAVAEEIDMAAKQLGGVNEVLNAALERLSAAE